MRPLVVPVGVEAEHVDDPGDERDVLVVVLELEHAELERKLEVFVAFVLGERRVGLEDLVS